MSLYEGYKGKQEEKNDKVKKIIVSTIIIVCLLMALIVLLIIYLQQQPNDISLILDGKANNKLLNKLKISKDESTGLINLDENGKPIIYAPIKEVASFIGYEANNGNYMTVSEDTDSCNVKSKKEVAIFTLDSDIVYKKDLTNSYSNYENHKINEKVFKEKEELYTSTEGLEVAFNMYITYDAKKNCIEMYSLDYYVEWYNTPKIESGLTQIQEWGYTGLDEKFVNQKAILDDMLIVKNEEGHFGVIKSNGEKILGTQYDSITYIPENKYFLIQSNAKFGIISFNGETKIKPIYNNLQLIDSKEQLYLVSENNKYGVIDINSKLIIPVEYNRIGIDINSFAENNIANNFIIQEKLIPVQQDGLWGFYDLTTGKLIGEGIIYDAIGCITQNSQGTAYNVLSISEFNVIVLKKDGKYGCINLKGETAVPFVADDVYMQISLGETKYIMSQTKNDKVYTKDIAELIK